MINNKHFLKLGLIGCGRFGDFCLKSYSSMDKIKVVAVADIDEKKAELAAKSSGVKWYIDPNSLIENPDIELIHIATPPYTHYNLAKQSLKNDKHVLCEKPLALSIQQAEELLDLARQKKKIIPVNFILRYVPIVDIVKKIIKSGIFGDPIHAFFENYATDESLDDDHWFWNKNKSGGIFIEHAVHFFDLYEYWFDQAEVLWAHAQLRSNTNHEDRVFCFLRHKTGVLSNHYHGFDQPGYMDRQTHRILLETGDVTVEGWIPIVLTLNGIVDDDKLSILRSICPNGELTVLKDIKPSNQHMRGRGKSIIVTKEIKLKYRSPLTKGELYAQAIRKLLLDQITFIQNPKHERIITENNGLEALKLALQASNFLK